MTHTAALSMPGPRNRTELVRAAVAQHRMTLLMLLRVLNPSGLSLFLTRLRLLLRTSLS